MLIAAVAQNYIPTPYHSSKLELAFFSKSTTNDIPLPFLWVLCEYRVAPVVLDDPPPGAKDALTLN
jgi:hypothetical protein